MRTGETELPGPADRREASEWSGPGARLQPRRFRWCGLLWSIIQPRRGHRILPTVPGVVLIALCLGLGTAAYNTSSNILFITLSLLLSCLILSGVLSWLNLRGVEWRLRLAPPLRAGHDTVVALDLRNGKTFLPTYGLGFELVARRIEDPARQQAESTVSAPGREIRAMLAKADAAVSRIRLDLPGRLDPRGEGGVEWILKPDRRGRLRVELAAVGSLFPFGFLRKDIGTEVQVDTIVWPAPVEYRRHEGGGARRAVGSEQVARAGSGGDLLALRRFNVGDSHRLIHWKASARTGTLLVRQFAAETAEGYSMWLRTDAEVWTRPDQFELLVRFVATLSEDLFRAGRLAAVAIDAEPPLSIRRGRDLETWLDRLALAEPTATTTGAGDGLTARQDLMTFAPDGARGVAAHVGGRKTASA